MTTSPIPPGARFVPGNVREIPGVHWEHVLSLTYEYVSRIRSAPELAEFRDIPEEAPWRRELRREAYELLGAALYRAHRDESRPYLDAGTDGLVRVVADRLSAEFMEWAQDQPIFDRFERGFLIPWRDPRYWILESDRNLRDRTHRFGVRFRTEDRRVVSRTLPSLDMGVDFGSQDRTAMATVGASGLSGYFHLGEHSENISAALRDSMVRHFTGDQAEALRRAVSNNPRRGETINSLFDGAIPLQAMPRRGPETPEEAAVRLAAERARKEAEEAERAAMDRALNTPARRRMQAARPDVTAIPQEEGRRLRIPRK